MSLNLPHNQLRRDCTADLLPNTHDHDANVQWKDLAIIVIIIYSVTELSFVSTNTTIKDTVNDILLPNGQSVSLHIGRATGALSVFMLAYSGVYTVQTIEWMNRILFFNKYKARIERTLSKLLETKVILPTEFAPMGDGSDIPTDADAGI